jgi:hypothetical protein
MITEYTPNKKGQKSRLERELARLNTGVEVVETSLEELSEDAPKVVKPSKPKEEDPNKLRIKAVKRVPLGK